MELSQYDGICIVHPADGLPRHPEYRKNMGNVARRCNLQRKPLFLASDSLDSNEVYQILVPSIPIFTGRNNLLDAQTGVELRNCYQRTVDFIARKVKKDPARIVLGFGGTNADQCVYLMAIMLCKRVQTNYPPEKTMVNALERPIAMGHIIDELI